MNKILQESPILCVTAPWREVTTARTGASALRLMACAICNQPLAR